MKNYWFVGLFVIISGMMSNVLAADMSATLKDNTTNSGFTIKEKTTDSTIVRFRGDGNVGIGTTNPTQKLEITNTDGNAFININSANNLASAIYHYNPDVGFGSGIGFFPKNDLNGRAVLLYGNGDINNHNAKVTLLHNGNVGIGYTSPSYKLDVNGTIRGSNISPSDMRWKEHVKTIDNSLEKVNKLRGVSFQWKDKAKGDGTQIGLIAQEVEKVFPEVVSEDNEGYKSVAYDKLVGALVESIKELKSENDALKQEIDSIKTFMSTHAQAVTVPASAQMR